MDPPTRPRTWFGDIPACTRSADLRTTGRWPPGTPASRRRRTGTWASSTTSGSRGKLRRQVQILEARPEIGVVYGQEIKRSTQDVVVWPGDREAPSGWIVRALLSNCPVNTSSVLIRQSAIERIGPFDESLRCWEDYDFWLQLACTEQFQFLPGPAVIYQISSSGRFLSSVVNGESAANLRKVVHAA